MKRHFRSAVVLGMLACSAGLAACSESFLTEDPPNIIVADNLFTDRAGFENGLNAVYSRVREERSGPDGGINNVQSMIYSVGTDAAWVNWDSNAERVWNDWGALSNSSFAHYRDYFLWLYRVVNATNTIVERAGNPAVRWTEAEKNAAVGEARLLRAWAYRQLVYNWGDVPLSLRETTGETFRSDFTRTPKDSVLMQVEADLLFAEANLPAERANSGRVARPVAQHYLAELYLLQGRNAEAEAKAQAAVANPSYRLVTARYGPPTSASNPDPLGCAFLDQFVDGKSLRSQGNTEVLWSFQLQFEVNGGGTNIMRRYWVNRYDGLRGLKVAPEYGGRGLGRLAMTKWALELYEPADERGYACAVRRDYAYNNAATLLPGTTLGQSYRMPYVSAAVNTERIRSNNWPSTRKWDWSNPNDLTGNDQFGDQPYLRLADTYLLLAEARFKNGNAAGAAELVNAVRARSKASAVTPNQITLDFLLDERARELATEEQRRYTLLRTGTWLDRVKRYNPIAGPKVAARDVLYPIPQAVIDANLTVAFPQNPGY